MTYAFTHVGNFLHLSLEARIWAFWIGFGPRDWDLGLGTRIWAEKWVGVTDGGGEGAAQKGAKQGRIHGSPVADGWPGAVMQKPHGI